MDLILWRHADAEAGSPDMARELTSLGLKQATITAGWLKPRLPADAKIMVSPALRTQQTVQALGLPFKLNEQLAPGKEAEDVLKAAGWPDAQGTVVVVGHQPTLGHIASLLLKGAIAEWNFDKSAVWWFTQNAETGRVELVANVNPGIISSQKPASASGILTQP